MRNFTPSLLVLATLWILGSAFTPAPVATSEDAGDGQAVFLAQKCNTCHSVQAAGIEAKTASEKMKGPDLSGYQPADGFDVAGYLHKKVEKDGEAHRLEFKGTDEELQVLLDWLEATK